MTTKISFARQLQMLIRDFLCAGPAAIKLEDKSIQRADVKLIMAGMRPLVEDLCRAVTAD